MTNNYCETLGIPVPSLEAVKEHREARPFSLLLVALLEHGGPMTLAEVAARFEQAGVAPAGEALASLKRCRPRRPPVVQQNKRDIAAKVRKVLPGLPRKSNAVGDDDHGLGQHTLAHHAGHRPPT